MFSKNNKENVATCLLFATKKTEEKNIHTPKPMQTE